MRRLLLFVLLASAAHASDRVELQVRVNGQPLRFGFDTGAGVESVIWRRTAERLGIKFTFPPADAKLAPGQVRAGITEPARFEFMGRTFDGSHLAVLDVPAFADWELEGLIGWPAVNKNIWILDLAHNGVTLVSRVPDQCARWHVLPVLQTARSLALRLPGPAGSHGGILAIDTGFEGGVCLSPSRWSQWKAANAGKPVTLDAYYTPGSAYVVREESWADQLTLGGVVLRGVTVEEASPSEAAGWGADYVATLGIAALKRLELVIDGRKELAYLNAGADRSPSAAHNRLGAVFVPTTPSGNDLVARVARGSPAAAAGIRDGDVLKRIGHTDVTRWKTQPGVWPLRRFFNQPAGTTLTLALERNHQTLTIPVELRDILGPRTAGPSPNRRSILLPEFEFIPAFAGTFRKGVSLDMPMDRLESAPPGSAAGIEKGDRVTALVTEADGGKLRQWLVELVADDAKPSEKRRLRPTGTMYTSSGHELRFKGDVTGIAIRIAGPFLENPDESNIKDVWSGALVSPQFLALGLDRMCKATRKIFSHNLAFTVAGKPFPARQAAQNWSRLQAAGITLDDERAFAGSVPALNQFYRIASQTPGLREILFRMLDLSWTEFLRRPQTHFEILGPIDIVPSDLWGLPPSTTCYEFGLRLDLNGKPRLLCRLAVTRPDRPLQTDAGILGIAVQRPDGQGPHLMIRLLAAHCAPVGKRGGI